MNTNEILERLDRLEKFCGINQPAGPLLDHRRMVQLMQHSVAEKHGLTVSDITGPLRYQNLIWPRHLAMYLARTLTPLRLEEIAKLFGNRDHGSVTYAVRNVGDIISTDPTKKAEFEEWLRVFKPPQ